MKLTHVANLISSISFLVQIFYKAKTLLEKAAKTMFVWKICTFNVDEIDP